MKKIILKCKLENRDKFEKKLSDIDMDFSTMYWQHDRVYVPRGYRSASNLPRLVLRTEMHAVDEPPKYQLIMRRHIEDSGIDIIESTPIEDYVGAAGIILQLGFTAGGEVSRRRQDLIMSERDLIHLDEIDGTNECYAKIEAILRDEDSVIEVRNDLKKTLELLGEDSIIERAYFEIKN